MPAAGALGFNELQIRPQLNLGPSNPRELAREFISTRISVLGLGSIRLMGWAADPNSP